MVSPVVPLLALALALAPAPQPPLVDAVVAVVDGRPLLASDLELARLAGLGRTLPGTDLLEARIRLEAAYLDLEGDRLEADTAAAYRRLLAAVGGEARLAAAGFGPADLEALARRVAAVEAYIARRLRPRVRVADEEVASAYRSEIVAPVAAAGGEPPPLEEVAARLRRLLEERRLNRLLEEWLGEVLARHRVEVLRRPPPAP